MMLTRERKDQRAAPWRPGIVDGCLLLVAVAIVLLSTPWGIGVGYDSTFYLSAADGVGKGLGLGRVTASGEWVPLTHFPPLYPLVVAVGMAMTGAGAPIAARYLGAVLFAVNVLLTAGIVRAWTGSRGIGAVAGVAFLFSPVLLERHLWAMSEPLYFTWMLLALGLLPTAIHSDKPWRLVGVGLLAGLAALTRYVGVALVGCGLASVLLLAASPWRKRFARAGLLVAGAAAPLLVWLVRSRRVSDGVTNRTLVFHPLTRDKIAEAARALAKWSVGPLPQWKAAAIVSAVLLLAVIVISGRFAIRMLRRPDGPGETESAATVVLLLHGAAYVGALLFSLTFFDASTRLDNRILSPLFITVLLLAAIRIPPWLEQHSRGWRLGVGALLVLVAMNYISGAVTLIRTGRLDGFGFQSRGWRTSEGADYAASLDFTRPLYSNESIPLAFLLDRPVYPAPERIDPVLAQVRPDYQVQLSTMRNRLQSENGVLLLFHPNALRVEMPSKAELTQGLGLRARLQDSEVYTPEG